MSKSECCVVRNISRGFLKISILKTGGSLVSDPVTPLGIEPALRLLAALGTVGLVPTPSLLGPQVKGICGRLWFMLSICLQTCCEVIVLRVSVQGAGLKLLDLSSFIHACDIAWRVGFF